MTPFKRIFLSLVAVLAVAVLLFSQQLARAQNAGNVRDAFAAGEPILPAQDKAAVIHLDAGVDNIMLRSIKRRVDIAQKAGCSVIIFEIDTFGGQAASGLDISKYLKELAAKRVITVAWIHNKAISEGAMIAAACQHVVISSEGSYGDCEPIAVETTLLGGHETTSLPAVVTEFDDSADKNHWDRAILRAMVVVAAQVHEIRNRATGEVKYVDDPGKDKFLALKEDVPGGGKIANWQYVQTVNDANGLLTLVGNDAVKMKLAEGTVDNEVQLKALLNIRGDLLRLEYSWAERATIFLTTWEMRMLFFVGMLVFAWLEFSHPGTTLFGIAALICLVLLVGAPFLTGIAQIWEIALIVIGVGIIVADFFAFGGVGMLAVPGFVLMAIGLVASFIPSDPNGGIMSSQYAWSAAERGLGVVVGGTFLAVGLFYLMAKYLAVVPGFRRLQLVPGGGKGGAAAVLVRDAADRVASEAVFVGALGRVASDLRPAGKARFGEHLVDVVSYGSFIEAGTEVVVIEVKGMRVVVKPHVPRESI